MGAIPFVFSFLLRCISRLPNKCLRIEALPFAHVANFCEMILKVVDAEEEGHYSAQNESAWNRIPIDVVLLDVRPHIERCYSPDGKRTEANQPSHCAYLI